MLPFCTQMWRLREKTVRYHIVVYCSCGHSCLYVHNFIHNKINDTVTLATTPGPTKHHIGRIDRISDHIGHYLARFTVTTMTVV